MKNKALIYCRVSTEEQATSDRHSLRTQLTLCEKAIEESNVYKLATDGTYEDPGRSATNMNRPGLQDLLLRIQEDKSVGAVFIQDTDRLARNANDHLVIKALLKKHEVKLVSVSQAGLEDTPEGNFMDLVIAGVNQFQSQITGRKTVKSMEQKFRDGGWPTHAPIGYFNTGEEGDEKKRTVTVDPFRGPLITEAFKMYSTGNYSIIEIRDILYEKGFRSKTNKLLQHSKMAEIFKNHFYYGEMRWRKLSNKGKHTPLIDKETFDQCQIVASNHDAGRCHRRKFNFILRGHVWCGRCGYRYTAEHHHKKGISYYHCNHYGNRLKKVEENCRDKYVEVTELENQVQEYFDGIQFSNELVYKIESRLKTVYKTKRDSVGQQKNRLQQTKLALEAKLETAEEKLIDGILDNVAFDRLKKRYREQIENIENEMIKADRSKNIKVDIIQQVLGLVRSVGDSYQTAPPQLKRIYLSLFWQRFEVENKLITKAIKSPILSAVEAIGGLSLKELAHATKTPTESSMGEFVINNSMLGAHRELNPN